MTIKVGSSFRSLFLPNYLMLEYIDAKTSRNDQLRLCLFVFLFPRQIFSVDSPEET